MPKQGKEGKIAESVAQIIKAWVKDWFFTIEDHDEFQHSKNEFDKWIRSLKDKQLPSMSVDSIFCWIKNSLEPLECLWVNYYRLLRFGLNGRTTSIGEALHWATKGAFDGVTASMNPATSANTQMTQAERKGNDLKRLNAQNVQFTNLWSESNTHEHLTDWAERYSQNEWELLMERRCIQVSSDEYWVYKPDDADEDIGKCM